MKPETKQKSKKVFDIISFIAIFLLFICSLLCLITRLRGATFDLFGNRYDVVLTDSMSTKNPEHEDFLKDYDNQFKAFDLALSKRLPAEKDDLINVGDVVIYTDRYIGTNMHRVVEKDTKYYERVFFRNASQASLNGHDGVTLDKIDSQLATNDIRFKTMSFTTYSTKEIDINFNFFALKLYTPEITRITTEDGGYLTTYKITRDSESPAELKISHKAIYDYSKEIITDVHIDSLAGAIDVDMNALVPSNEESETYMATFNHQFIYRTRGDAAKDDDGWYSYNELQAVVTGNMPGMGYPIRFMGSNWGGLMFALLALLILIVDIIATRMDKKEAAKAAAEPAKKVEEVKPTPTPVVPVAPVPSPKPVEPVKKPEPVVNLTVNTTTIKRDPNTGKEEVIKSSRVVQLKPGDNKTFSNTVNMTNATPSAQPAKAAPQPAKPAETAAKPTQNAAKPVAPAKPAALVKPASPVKPNTSAKPATSANKPAPAQVKPAAPSNGTVLRKSENNVPPKGDKK